MPLNASMSPSTTPRTAPCKVQATSGSPGLQFGVWAEAAEADTANRKTARALAKCRMSHPFHITAQVDNTAVEWRYRYIPIIATPNIECCGRRPTIHNHYAECAAFHSIDNPAASMIP